MDKDGCPPGQVRVKGECIQGIEWGFDCTHFGTAKKFKQILLDNDLPENPRIKNHPEKKMGSYTVPASKTFIWENNKISMETQNNPISGEYTRINARHIDPGFASYIGIQGNSPEVQKIVDDIKRATRSIKAESPCERRYI